MLVLPTAPLQLLKKDAPINMKKLKSGFTLVELLIVITIIGILSSIGLNSFTSSQVKGRDTKRKAHLKQLTDAFEAYYNDKGEYPSDDGSGNVMGCGVDAEAACTWGTSAFVNTTTTTVYMILMPEDPTTGRNYFYDAAAVASLNTQYQLYARLENTLDQAVPKNGSDEPQAYPSTTCSATTPTGCNYGTSSTNSTLPTPVDE